MTMPNQEHSFEAAQENGKTDSAAAAETAGNAFRLEYLLAPPSQIATRESANMARQLGGNISPEGIRKIVEQSEEMAKAFAKMIASPKDAPAVGEKAQGAVDRSLDMPPLDELSDKVIDIDKESKGILLLEEDFKKIGPRMDEFLRDKKFTSMRITPLEEGFRVALTRDERTPFYGTEEKHGYTALKVDKSLSFEISAEKGADGKPTGVIEVRNIEGLTTNRDIPIFGATLNKDVKVSQLYIGRSQDKKKTEIEGHALGGSKSTFRPLSFLKDAQVVLDRLPELIADPNQRGTVK